MDELLKQAIEITIENGHGSVSLLQMKLILGYNRAERIMEQMEKLGVVGSRIGSHPRELLIKNINDIDLPKKKKPGVDRAFCLVMFKY